MYYTMFVYYRNQVKKSQEDSFKLFNANGFTFKLPF